MTVFFKTLDQVLSSTEALAAAFNTSFMNDSDWFFNSRVASITMRPRPSDVITPPLRLALETQKVLNDLLFLTMKSHNAFVKKNGQIIVLG